MATILPSPVGKQKQHLHALKIDMTPMVDLGFLLITFFIFTAALTQPTVTKLVMPKQDAEPMRVFSKTLLTVIVDKGKVIAYEGTLSEAMKKGGVKTSNWDAKTGFGRIVRQKQAALAAIGKRDELMVAIKPLNSSSYQDVINALDEMLINCVSRYAVANLSEEERELVK